MTTDLASYLAGRLERHAGLLTGKDQQTLSSLLVCGAGAGGVGGWTYEALARLGCRRFRIADPENYDASNANRQAGCNATTVGRNKAEVTRDILLRLNPAADVTAYPEGVTDENVRGFLDGGAIVLDGIDLARLDIKKKVYDTAREMGIPVLSCPILGFGCAMAFFDPKTSPSFEEYFGPLPAATDEVRKREYAQGLVPAFFSFRPSLDWPVFRQRVLEGKVPSVGVATMLSGALAAAAIVSHFCGKRRIPAVPTTLHIDLMERRIRTTGPLKRRLLRWIIRRMVRRLAEESAASAS